MVKRICPICDQAMKGKHYCPVCRSYVKNPIIMNRDYYLNERHPAYETDCEYHNPASTGKKAGNPVTSFILIFFVIMFLISLLSAVIPFMMSAL